MASFWTDYRRRREAAGAERRDRAASGSGSRRRHGAAARHGGFDSAKALRDQSRSGSLGPELYIELDPDFVFYSDGSTAHPNGFDSKIGLFQKRRTPVVPRFFA